MHTILFRKVSVLTLLLLMTVAAQGDEPGWTNTIIKRGAERAAMEALPIIERPYRPLHFYGNTVRRRYYRHHTLPAPRDLGEGVRALRSDR